MVVLKTLLGLGVMIGVVFGIYKLAMLLAKLLGEDVDDLDFGLKALFTFLTVVLLLVITLFCFLAYMIGNSITC